MPDNVIRKPWVIDKTMIYRRFLHGETTEAIARDVRYSLQSTLPAAISYVQRAVNDMQSVKI